MNAAYISNERRTEKDITTLPSYLKLIHKQTPFTMKFFIIAALVAVACAVPYDGHGYGNGLASYAHGPVYHQPTTVLQTHAQTLYAPITKTQYGSQVNHLVPVPAPIIKGVPQPYAVPVPQPYAVPRAVPVAVPRAVPVAVPRAVPVPLVAQAAPLVTKSVVHAPTVYAQGGYADQGYAGQGLVGQGYGYANQGYGYDNQGYGGEGLVGNGYAGQGDLGYSGYGHAGADLYGAGHY